MDQALEQCYANARQKGTCEMISNSQLCLAVRTSRHAFVVHLHEIMARVSTGNCYFQKISLCLLVLIASKWAFYFNDLVVTDKTIR